jgi:short-subunit dehydrogenase
MDSLKDKKVWIIGASSGIGAALAAELFARGSQLVLSARRMDELEKLKSTLGNAPDIEAFDVSNAEHLAVAAQKHGPFDSVIFLAAAYNPTLLEHMNIAEVHKTIDININGALNTIQAVYGDMRARKSGQIVLCGSVAGYCGLPYSQPYSLTKAAIMSLAQSLKTEAAFHGVDVKLISPGFVRTPLTDKNDFAMPMMIEPAKAAKAIADGLLKSSFEIHFPKKFTWIVKILSLLPYILYFKITKSILKKKQGEYKS